MGKARTITCIDDLQRLARRRVPRLFYDYVDAGSWTERTYRANGRDIAAIELRQRVAVDVAERSTAATMAGAAVAMPVALAPAGLAGMQRADGEILAAQAAEAAGVPFTLSTVSICSIEDVAGAVAGPFWFQLYVMKDRGFTRDLIGRARAAGCSALVLTLDLPVQGQRHKDIRNGLAALPRMTLASLADMAAKPAWWWGMLGARRRSFGNIVGHAPDVGDTASMARWVSEQIDPSLDWDDVLRIKEEWGGTLILKGIMEVEDARRAAALGADAIVVSNHGGRQLDGAPSTIRALPPIVDAVGDAVEVHFDGGIRSGQDVFKAIALGARGTYVGRAYLYGLGALGRAGVASCLDILRRELDLTMALCGVRTIDRITRETLNHASS